jgi:ABC-type multidrug transport system fused ATPase/permease subunit
VISQSSAVPIYISETAHPKIRGSLVTLDAFALATGYLGTWILSYFLTWRMTAYLLIIPPMILIMLLFPLPETPYWLVENNDNKRAKQSLQFFRGKSYNITDEYYEIQQKHESKQSQHSKNWWKFTIKKICSSAFFKPFLCIGIVFALNEWSGFITMMTYTFEIFNEMGSSVDLGIGLVVIASIRVVTAGMNLYFVHFTYNIEDYVLQLSVFFMNQTLVMTKIWIFPS